MTNTWTQNTDGSITFNGSVTFPAGTNLASGAGVMILGPTGGVATFPAATVGPPGPSPTFTQTVVQVAYGSALPSPNPAVVFTPAAGATPPNYALTFYINAGQPGTSAANTLISPAPSDLEGSPAAGMIIGYSVADTKAQWQPKPVGKWYWGGSIAATTSNNNTSKNLRSIVIPVQLFDWWPEVLAQTTVIGAVDTRVDLVARINATGGPVCAYGYGAPGAAPPPVIAIPNGLEIGSNVIAAGAGPTTIFLNAENQTASVAAWNTTSSTTFQVRPSPVPS